MVPPTVSHKHVKFSIQLIDVTDINIRTLIPNLEVFAQNSKSGSEVVIGTFSCLASCLHELNSLWSLFCLQHMSRSLENPLAHLFNGPIIPTHRHM